MTTSESLYILVIDDDLDLDDCRDDPMAALAWVSAKRCCYSFNYERVREQLNAYSMPVVIHAARTATEACKMLAQTAYTIVFLDGGFDSVMNAIADAQDSELCPKYLVPMSASFKRNCDIRAKLAMLSTTTHIPFDFADQLGISSLV